jgi:hypothetical protein
VTRASFESRCGPASGSPTGGAREECPQDRYERHWPPELARVSRSNWTGSIDYLYWRTYGNDPQLRQVDIMQSDAPVRNTSSSCPDRGICSKRAMDRHDGIP